MDRKNRFLAAGLLAGGLALTGCADKKKPVDSGAAGPPPAPMNDQSTPPTVSTLPPPAPGASVPIGPDVAPGPAPMASESARPERTGAVPGGIYIVKKGDYLYAIARKVYHDTKMVHAIIKANPGIDPNHLKVGQKLKLPAVHG